MRYVDTKMFSRWIIVGAAIMIPLAVGCGSKTDSRPETSSAVSDQANPDQASPDQASTDQASAGQQPAEVPQVEVHTGADGPAGGESPGREDQADNPGEAATPAVDSGDAGLPDADRPRSLFRSIGRALGKGITDAVGGSSGASSAPADSAEPAPADPR